MKIILILIIILITNCTIDKKENNNNPYLLPYLISTYKTNDCRINYSDSNVLFAGNEYYPKFINMKPNENTILGDSTMDISGKVNGFISNKTNNFSVSGNTLCDILEQLNTLNPKLNNVIISTIGGNDILRSVNKEVIYQTTNELLKVVKSFQSYNSKIVTVGVHPTRIDFANRNRIEINKRTKELTESINGCYIDIDDLFTIESDGKASQFNMLDSIHYNSNISLGMKNKVSNICKINI